MNDVTITVIDSRSLGRCYSSVTYRVQSPREITPADWNVLRAARRLGYGQEFYTKSLGVVDGVHTYEAEDRVDSSD